MSKRDKVEVRPPRLIEDGDDVHDVSIDVEEGDVCEACGTTVAPRWSGIACDCGRLAFCY